MNIDYVGKRSAQLCVCTLMMSILLLPVQAAQTVPVPVFKPVMQDGTRIPIPFRKPRLTKESQSENKRGETFKAMTLNLASLFSTENLSDQKEAETYIHGYRPLSGEQSKIYANIFEAQALDNLKEVNALLPKVRDGRLMGHVFYRRYMKPSYKASFSELQAWMARYADHPGADKIYKLAVSRKDAENTEEVTKPKNGNVLSQVNEPTIYHPKRYRSKINRDKAQEKLVYRLSRKVRALVRTGKPLKALKHFKNSEARDFMDKVEHDIVQSQIAGGFLYSGRLESAYKLAVQSADRSGSYAPEAGWIAGLALWQQGEFAQAAAYFDMAGKSTYASGWLSSAGSYWAARGYQRADNQDKLRSSLVRAAKHSRTFYGLMAAHALGETFDFNWDVPEYGREHESLILSIASGKRAFSLVAAGQYDLAESELLRLEYKGNMKLRRAVLAYASHVGLPGVALRLGNMVQRTGGKYYDSALYPVSPWSPKDGYRIDPALVHAVIRQESRFNLQATSYSGAIGLMQIMPKTAQYVAKMRDYPENLSTSKLRLPETNMKVGQDYLEYLLKGRYVKGDVVSLLVSYNAGPGNLAKWRKRMGDNQDPLLFIETLPVQETRDYVERVLSNYWIYRLRAGLDLPSLVSLSSGKLPQYAHVMQTEYPYKLAANQ